MTRYIEFSRGRLWSVTHKGAGAVVTHAEAMAEIASGEATWRKGHREHYEAHCADEAGHADPADCDDWS